VAKHEGVGIVIVDAGCNRLGYVIVFSSLGAANMHAIPQNVYAKYILCTKFSRETL